MSMLDRRAFLSGAAGLALSACAEESDFSLIAAEDDTP